MNILFVSHKLYPCAIGGAEIFNYYLMQELSKHHNIFLITSCKRDLPFNADVVRINPRRFLLKRFSVPLQDFINIARLRNKIDLFHISYMRSNALHWLPYPLLKWVYGIPYLISIRGGSMHQWKPRIIHNALFKNADAIIGVSNRIKEEYEKRSQRTIDFVPSSLPFVRCDVDKEGLRRDYGYKGSDTIILYVGTLKRIKGCDTLLDAFINLGMDFIDANRLRLCFVGDGNMRSDLERRTREAGMSRCVSFQGPVSREGIPCFYKMADIYAIPSLFEGKSNSLLEAMFNKMPIIASDASGINDVVVHEKNGLLFKVGDCKDLARKIIYLVENKHIGIEIAKAARETFDKGYTFKSVVSRYLQIYKTILQKRCKA